DAVLSHTSAARVLGLPLYGVDAILSHVTRTDPAQSGRTQAGITHHDAFLEQGEIQELLGLRTTIAERTVADLAREFGFLTGLVAADAALHQGSDRTRMTAIADRMTPWSGGQIV